MSILGWIVLGLISGFIASKIVNRTGEGVFLDIILGIVGIVLLVAVAGFGVIGSLIARILTLGPAVDVGRAGRDLVVLGDPFFRIEVFSILVIWSKSNTRCCGELNLTNIPSAKPQLLSDFHGQPTIKRVSISSKGDCRD